MNKSRAICSQTGTQMRNTKLLMELEALAERLGIQVIHENLSESCSGLCRLYNQYMLLVEKNLEADEQVEVFVKALSRFPIDNVHVLPGIRHLLEEYHLTNQAQIKSAEASQQA